MSVNTFDVVLRTVCDSVATCRRRKTSRQVSRAGLMSELGVRDLPDPVKVQLGYR